MLDTVAESETSTPEQEARAKLRESFLRALKELNGEPCSILTYENTTLNAKFKAWNPNGQELLVNDLKTPACVEMKTALLRTPDILAIHFDKPL